MVENQVLIFSLLSVLVFLLATYLGFLLNKLRLQKKVNDLHLLELESLRAQRQMEIKDSLGIIARAVINKQCELSEGCIRIKKLMDEIELNSSIDEGLEPFERMYEELKDFAYLDARSRLSNQEKFNQDKKRFRIEDDYEAQILDACKVLLETLDQ